MKKLNTAPMSYNSYDGCLYLPMPDGLKNIKVVDAFVKVYLDTASVTDKTFDVSYINNANDPWGVVDRVSLSAGDSYFEVNISDEFQDALDRNQSKMKLRISEEDLPLLSDHTFCWNIDYISLAEHESNASSQTFDIKACGKLMVNNVTGQPALNVPLISSDSRVLPLELSSYYDKNTSKLISNTGMPKNWRLNVQQFLVKNPDDKDTLSFTYIDSLGKEHLIEEKYYYIDEQENKVYIPREKVLVLPDGSLACDVVVDREFFVIKDEPVLVYGKYRQFAYTKAQMESLFVKLESYIGDTNDEVTVKFNDEITLHCEQFRCFFSSENVQRAVMYLKNDEYNITFDAERHLLNENYGTYSLLSDSGNSGGSDRKNEGTEDYIPLNNYIKLTSNNNIKGEFVFNHKETVKKQVYTSLEAPNGLKLVSSIEGIKGHEVVDYEPEELSTVKAQLSQLTTNRESYKANLKNIKTQIMLSALSNYRSKLGHANVYLSSEGDSNVQTKTKQVQSLESITEILNSETKDFEFNEIDYSDFYQSLVDYGNEKNTFAAILTGNTASLNNPSIGDVDMYSINANMDNYKKQYKDCEKQLKLIEDNIIKLEHQKCVLEKQVPVHYLYGDESLIYGFGKADSENNYRLVLIVDSYENTIYIDYNDFETNIIKSIVDAQGKAIEFDYKAGKLSQIVDANDNVYAFDVLGGNLKSISLPDGNMLHYYYQDDNLIGAIDKSYFGVFVEYNELNRIAKVSSVSANNGVTDGVITVSDGFDFNNANLGLYAIADDYVEFVYNNYKSTTIKNGEGKIVTYLFDKLSKERTIYQIKGVLDEEQDLANVAQNPHEHCIEVSSFDYKDNNLSLKTNKLIYSPNYLEDVNFESNTTTTVSNLFLGNFMVGSDAVPYTYEVDNKYHTILADKQSKVDCMVMSEANLQKINDSQDICGHRCFMVSGFAKADSAFIVTDEAKNFKDYITSRKFEIRAEVKYQDEPNIVVFSQPFDWRNTDWQYCSLPIILENKAVESISCYIDYSNNLGKIEFSDLELTEADYSKTQYINNLPSSKESGHSRFKTLYEYLDGKLVCETVLDKKTNEQYKTHYTYNRQGKVISVVDYNDIVVQTQYNENGMAVKTKTYNKNTPALAFVREHNYDDRGNELKEFNEFNEELSTKTIDSAGNIACVSSEHGNSTCYAYDKNRNVLQMLTSVDNKDNTNTYGYAMNFLTSVSHNGFDIGYDYDDRGRLAKVNVAGNMYLQKIYQDKEQTTILSNKEKFRQEFNSDGKVVKTFFTRKPNVDENQSDIKEVLLSENIYDTYGNLVKTKTAKDQLTGILDISKYTQEEVDTSCYMKTYTLDKFGNVIATTSEQNGREVKYVNTFDEEHKNVLASQVIIDNQTAMSYEYSYENTPDGGLTCIKLPDGVFNSIGKDKLGRLNKLGLGNLSKEFKYVTKNGYTSNLICEVDYNKNNLTHERLTYNYDQKGNIKEVRKNNRLVARYLYDSLSRLVREDNVAFNKTYTFSYDEGGNILEKREYALTLVDNLEFEEFSNIEYDYKVEGWKDQLARLSVNGKEELFDYDELGNPLVYRGYKLEWSQGRRLNRFGNIASFAYNAEGVRTTKITKDNIINYILNGTNIVRQSDSNNTLDFIYGIEGVIGFKTNNQTYYYKKNAQNDVLGIYDQNGVEIVRYEYDAFGNQKIFFLVEYCQDATLMRFEEYTGNEVDNPNAKLAILNPFRYRSYYYDSETNLYYLNSRYYDPELGRFINADDINVIDESLNFINGLNLYSYCNNNPVNNVDDSGFAWWHWLVGLAIIVLAAVLTVVTAGGFAAAGAAFAGALGIGSAVGGVAGFFAAVTIGAATGAILSSIGGGITSIFNGESYLDGASENFMWGAISGAISGGFSTFKFKGIGNFAKNKGNIFQIAGHATINLSSYIVQSISEDNPINFSNVATSLFSGVTGGLVNKSTLVVQMIISTLHESLNIVIEWVRKEIKDIIKNMR